MCADHPKISISSRRAYSVRRIVLAMMVTQAAERITPTIIAASFDIPYHAAQRLDPILAILNLSRRR